jgi:hypothetical protein
MNNDVEGTMDQNTMSMTKRGILFETKESKNKKDIHSMYKLLIKNDLKDEKSKAINKL